MEIAQISTLIFATSLLLLIINMIYGGIWILKRLEKYSFILWLFLIAAGIGCIISLSYISNPPILFTGVIIAMFSASLFHYNAKKLTTQDYLQDYLNYKIFIELLAVALTTGGLIFLLYVDVIYIAVAGFLCVVYLSYHVYLKKRSYKTQFKNALPLTQPRISIVIISLNEEKYIGNLLDSITKQTINIHEIILVDDKSTDSTVKIAQNYITKLPLKIVTKDKRGISASRNYGASLASGDIIFFFDSDVIISPDHIEKTTFKFINNNLAFAASDFEMNFDALTKNILIDTYRLWLKTVQFINPRGIGFGLVARKDMHDMVKFDEEVLIAEDFDYTERASKYGKFRIISDSVLTASIRRFNQERAAKLFLKYLLFELYRTQVGPIKKKIMSYQFGHYNKK